MFYVVYIDVLFLVNFFMDFVVLTTTGALLKIRTGLIRRILGAALGALCYCITLYLPWKIGMPGRFGIMLAAACVMGRIVFSIRGVKKLCRFLLIFHASAFFLGGAVTAIYNYTRLGYYLRKAAKGDLYAQRLAGVLALIVLASCVFGKVAAASLRQRKKEKELYCEILLSHKGRNKRASALLDTGNHLKEPVSRKPVILMDIADAGELLDKSTEDVVREFYKTGTLKEAGERIRMVPYHSVGKNYGMLAAVFLEQVQVQMEDETVELSNVCTGFTEGPVSASKNYQVIFNIELLSDRRKVGDVGTCVRVGE